MSATIPRLVASAATEDVVAGLREHGAVIVEGVLAPDLLARFNAVAGAARVRRPRCDRGGRRLSRSPLTCSTPSIYLPRESSSVSKEVSMTAIAREALLAFTLQDRKPTGVATALSTTAALVLVLLAWQ